MRMIRTALALGATALVVTAVGVNPAVAAERSPAPKAPMYCTLVVDTGEGGCFATKAEAAQLGGQAEYKDLGRIWSDANSGGSEFTFRGSVGCNWRYPEFNDLGKWGWNDTVSSAQGITCPITLWEHRDFRGASQTYHGYNAYVGDGMNDKATSVSFDLR
ncbi:peptidase inhibitor family I36 protein [Streptomyces sp. NBC_00513]|uniref:hypothetical protein n=1 Tax=unclassified Streptomyces TaxID=2593676 RepID=UPI0022563BAC|nr:hypothetical protein [Streptomyces sp. NBC_00424]MCX5077134.1 peptidase inhibitor family I36 protein [Streptomyces sp. NBC_00424]WUD39873.1 peptidase inhibitor family I36 protein [Streptomyces sp. NBC_00513]